MRTGNPEPRPIFFFVHWQMKTCFFYNNLKIIAVVNEGAKVLDICTTLMGLSDLASDVSLLFAEPMFLFRWALCNTSTYCKLTFWLSCVNSIMLCEGNFHYSRDSYKTFLFALFWLPRVNLSLQNQLPYYTISFSWNKRLLEPEFLCDECSVNLCNNTFPLMKMHFPLIKFISTRA